MYKIVLFQAILFLALKVYSQTSCPRLVFQESYSVTNGQTRNYTISPTYTLNCGTNNTWTVGSGQVIGKDGFTFIQTQRSLVLFDWSTFSSDSFYNLTFRQTFVKSSTNEQIQFDASFFLVIGTVSQSFSVDYSQAYDPQQPISANLLTRWQCESVFAGCINMTKTSLFDPINRIAWYRMVFDKDYSFTVTIQNPTTRFLKQVTDNISIKLNSPENSAQPLSCIDFNLVFRNQTYPVVSLGQNEVQIWFDNQNYTDIRIMNPSVNIANCRQFTTQQNVTAFAQLNNPTLIDDFRSYPFNSTDILISKLKIQSAISPQLTQSLKFYVYLWDSQTRQINGFQYKKLTLRMNAESLYSVITKPFIQVDKDKVLYIDGSTSFDARQLTTNFTYVWQVEGMTLSLPNSRILTLTPDQRTTMGLNTPGKYYNYTLRIQDQTRLSSAARSTIQITPEMNDPNQCIKLELKDIDIEKIVAYTVWPLMLQVRVIRSTTCTNLVSGSLVWSSQTINWQFWALFGNNNTIVVDRDNLKQLPNEQNIYMTVTQYYMIRDIEYVAKLTFVFIVSKPDLVPVVSYPRVININTQNLTLNATASYDPQANSAGTVDIPITCSWACAPAFAKVCPLGNYSMNNCLVTFNKTAVQSDMLTYITNIAGNAILFTLTITKDNRQSKAYVFVTFVDSSSFPNCTIDAIQDFEVNSHAFLIANCTNTVNVSYAWSFYNWTSSQEIPEIRQLTNNQQILRVPPYILSQHKEIMILMSATNRNQYTTPIALYKVINNADSFIRGAINNNFNSFTSFLSSYIMTPTNWLAQSTQKPLYQYRIKFADSPLPQFKVLLSPYDVALTQSITTILPPIDYDINIYIDIVDLDGNYYTVKQAIISQMDVLMTVSTFQIRVQNIVNDVNYQFEESSYELNLQRLRTLFQAYGQDQMDFQGVPISYFKTLIESTIDYLYNDLVIDQRLRSVIQKDRQIIIRQHVIEILHFITKKHQDHPANIKVLQTLVSMTNSTYYLGSSLPEISFKAISCVIQIANTQFYTFYDQVITNVAKALQYFMYMDEKVEYSVMDQKFLAYEIGNTDAQMPDFDNFQYPKKTVYNTRNAQGILMFIRNDTTAGVIMTDSKLSRVTFTTMTTPINVTFKLTFDQLTKYHQGNLTFFCQARDEFGSVWINVTTRISIASINNQTGQIVCRSTILSQISLYIIDKTLNQTAQNVTVIIPQTGEQIVEGKNTTIEQIDQPKQGLGIQIDEPFIYNEQKTLFLIIALLTLCFFILSSFGFHLRYKGEHQVITQEKIMAEKFELNQSFTLNKNRAKLYRKVLVHFNPYLNLFMVYNKFLARWVRNSLLQIYFMTISLIYGVNQTLLSLDQTDFGKDSSVSLIGLFAIVVIFVLFGRPWAIKIFYRLLYEPDSKVENTNLTTQTRGFIAQDLQEMQIQELDHEEQFMKDIRKSMKSNETENIFKHGSFNIMMNQGAKTLNSQRGMKDFEQTPIVLDDEKINHTSYIGRNNRNLDSQSFNSNNSVKNKSFQFEENQRKSSAILQNQINRQSTINLVNQTADKTYHIVEEESKEHDQSLDRSPSSSINNEYDKQFQQNGPDFMMQDNNPLSTSNIQPQNDYQFHLPDINTKPNRQVQNIIEPEIEFNNHFPNPSNQWRPRESLPEPQIQPKFQLPDINQHKYRFSDLPPLVTVPSNENEIKKYDPEMFDEFNNLEMEMEGGDSEEFKEVELDREDSQPEATLHYNTHLNTIQNRVVSDNEGLQHTEFLGGMQNMNTQRLKNSSKKLYDLDDVKKVNQNDSIKSANSSHLIQDEQESEIMPKDKKLFINKMIGKLILFLTWVGLAAGNMLCIQRMKREEFVDWIILSLVTFFAIIFIIDPLIYWILTCQMIKTPQDKKVQYFTRKRYQRRGCIQIFIILMIGREKMKDLKRKLNPQI